METIYEKHMRLLSAHTTDESCFCNPTWSEPEVTCDGRVIPSLLTHHLSESDGVR